MELDKYYNLDCMDGMKKFPNKYFDLAIVDPPYYSGPEKNPFYGPAISYSKHSSQKYKNIINRKEYKPVNEWKIPDNKYFLELKRISQNQIIWGINYFDFLNIGSGRIIWDKVNYKTSYSDCEIAYCSIHDSVRLFRYMWNGMMQGKSIIDGHIQQGNKKKNEFRIHPTQKPVVLYRWLLQNYAKPGFKIIDTHVGSGSSIIAFIDGGYDWIGFEINKYYYDLSVQRIQRKTDQIRMAL